MSRSWRDQLDQIPRPPDECDQCGGHSFTPRTKPVRADVDKDYAFAYHECEDCQTTVNERPDELFVDPDHTIPTWRDFFGHPEPYDHQEEAIVDCIEMGRDHGFTVMEGGCGTGKTMISLVAGLQLVRDPRTSYKRVMVLTSVKQQLRQFEDDLAIINENLPDDIAPAKGLTMVGKQDLCPYTREPAGEISADEIGHRCQDLRQQTSDLLSNGVDGVELAQSAETGVSNWSTAGVELLYESNVMEHQGHEYCPFYAFHQDDDGPDLSFGSTDNAIFDSETLVQEAAVNGLCPHSGMSSLAADAEVVIANYYHAFDVDTRKITGQLIDEETFIICDEAHMLEQRVRSVLSSSMSVYELSQAASEAASVHNALVDLGFCNGDRETDVYTYDCDRQAVQHQFQQDPVIPGAAGQLSRMLQRVHDWFVQYIEQRLVEKYGSVQQAIGAGDETVELPLRSPDTPQTDPFSEWAVQQDLDIDQLDRFRPVADTVEAVLADQTNVTSVITEVVRTLREWVSRDNTRNFRTVSLHRRDSPHQAFDNWQRDFRATATVESVMPRALIGNTLNMFGGGILMSATLEPIDVYMEVTGLDYLRTFENVPVQKRVYTADFPQENRLSLTVSLPRFTYSNRGDISELNDVRKQYMRGLYAISQITPGNVLICMPSYREARWVAHNLRQHDRINKEVLVDESSSETETQQLKQRFFTGDPKVLITSLRGTLTEGVDYDGDKLLACVVCGVPISNVGSPITQAIEAAYTDEYGGAGFDYALTVPAIRKTRQALGRVIRGTEDVGVRVLMDERYAPDVSGSVRHYLSEQEQQEYQVVDDVTELMSELQQFWGRHQST